MSAYKTITCSIKDVNILMAALKYLKYTPVVYKEKHKLHGYEDDLRDQEAEIIVPKNQISNVSNDLGFSYDAGSKEYVMICSDYDITRGVGDKVKQAYAFSAIREALNNNKFNINQSTEKKKITINASKII